MGREELDHQRWSPILSQSGDCLGEAAGLTTYCCSGFPHPTVSSGLSFPYWKKPFGITWEEWLSPLVSFFCPRQRGRWPRGIWSSGRQMDQPTCLAGSLG